MKTQIHELRTRIDGLAQLVRSLDKPILMIARDNIPSDMTIEDIVNEYERCGKVISVSNTPQVEYKGGLSFLAETYKSLLLAKAWLGKVLAELGEETPYKNDGNRKTAEDIEPTADRFKVPELIDCGTGFDFTSLTYIEKIDWIREEIEKCIKLSFGSPEADKCLTEARFFLCFELSRIKEQSK